MKYNKDTFIKKAIQIHKNRYNYADIEYKNLSSKITVICDKHGEFQQIAKVHLKGHGCRKCAIENNKRVQSDKIDNFIKKANKVHGNYDYSLSNYINCKTKLTIVCPKHGKFQQTPNSHLKGSGCPDCATIIVKNKLSDTKTAFIEKANKIHGQYLYTKVNYINNRKKVTITCTKHGDFKQTPDAHLRGSGCPTCKSSKGELKVQKWLVNNDIEHLKEYSFNRHNSLKTSKNGYLRFDFYLPEKNTCIEFDGMQHFIKSDYFGGVSKLEKTQAADKVKDEFCIKQNIKLIRINYLQLNEIEKILEKELL